MKTTIVLALLAIFCLAPVYQHDGSRDQYTNPYQQQQAERKALADVKKQQEKQFIKELNDKIELAKAEGKTLYRDIEIKRYKLISSMTDKEKTEAMKITTPSKYVESNLTYEQRIPNSNTKIITEGKSNPMYSNSDLYQNCPRIKKGLDALNKQEDMRRQQDERLRLLKQKATTKPASSVSRIPGSQPTKSISTTQSTTKPN